MHAKRKEENQHEFHPILLDRKAAARLLGVCSRTVDHLIDGGKLKPTRIGQRLLLQYEGLQEFAKDGR